MIEEINVKKQLRRSLPMAFENLINILMTLVDTLAISTIGVSELGAIGAMSVILNLMQISIQTINVSNNTLVARSIGENKQEKLKLTTGNAIIMTLIISLVTIITTYVVQPIFPTLFEVDKICITYLTIRLIGFIQSSLVTVLSGHQRTIGNQEKILKLRIFAVIINLIMDFVVVKLGYGIAGVAWVTVAIDTVLMVYLLIVSKPTLICKFEKNIFNDLRYLFKWNFVERIASKVDNFIFNIIVARMGKLEYAVHVILIQVVDIYETFIKGFGDGITITVGIASGDEDKNSLEKIKQVAKKLINKVSVIFPAVVFIMAILVMSISLKDVELQNIFYKVLPLLLIGAYFTISGTYYFAILRGLRDFKFLAKRNIITSSIKIILAIILAYTPLGIIGVWIAYVAYGIVLKYLSKCRYNELKKE